MLKFPAIQSHSVDLTKVEERTSLRSPLLRGQLSFLNPHNSVSEPPSRKGVRSHVVPFRGGRLYPPVCIFNGRCSRTGVVWYTTFAPAKRYRHALFAPAHEAWRYLATVVPLAPDRSTTAAASASVV